MLAVDEMILQIYQTLKSKQLLDETYIIFTSDNGYHIGSTNFSSNTYLIFFQTK